MLFHSTPCQQPWRTSKVVRNQCHWPCLDLLESQTSPKTGSPSCSLATSPQLDSRPSTVAHFPCPSNPMLQHHLADSFHRDCLHKVPVGYGQLVQSQRGRYQAGWWRDPKMYLWRFTTSCSSSSPIWSPLGPGGRQPTFRWRPTHIHSDGLTSKQNFPALQRNPDIPSPCSADVDYPELTPFITKNPSWWTLAPIYSLPLPHPPQSHHAQRHRTLQTPLSRGHLSQRGQARYIPTNLLPSTLLPVPHHHLRRPVGVSKIGEQPKWHHREDHRRDQ